MKNAFQNCPNTIALLRQIHRDKAGRRKLTVSYEILTEFMSQFMDSLKLDSAYVIGWSAVGIPGLLFADKRPDKIKKLISVGPNNGFRGAIPPNFPIDSVKPLRLDEWEKINKASIPNYMNILLRAWRNR